MKKPSLLTEAKTKLAFHMDAAATWRKVISLLEETPPDSPGPSTLLQDASESSSGTSATRRWPGLTIKPVAAGPKKRYRPGRKVDREGTAKALAILLEASGPVHRSSMAKQLKCSDQAIGWRLYQLKKEGKALFRGNGWYEANRERVQTSTPTPDFPGSL